MGRHPDPERFYIEEIMPKKLSINLEYLSRRTLLSDIGVILNTFRAVSEPESTGSDSQAT